MSAALAAPTIIPGLPESIRIVPPAPPTPDHPLADQMRTDWVAWRDDVIRYRVEIRHRIRQNPDLIALELQKCANHPAYLASVWLTIFEPRRRKIGTGAMPFVTFARQVEVIDILLATLAEEDDENADAVWSKCRGWGATWIACLIAIWGWRFSYEWGDHAPVTRGPWNMLLISHKEELVDSKKQKAIFKKIDRLLRDFPEWMMPQDFDWMLHRMKLSLFNPVNDNELVGESTTTKTGRGDRGLLCWVDEGASIPFLAEVWATLSDTADHRWAASTESIAEGLDWVQLRTGRLDTGVTPKLIETDWWENPTLDDQWLERQRKRSDVAPGYFEREIMRNPEGGMTDSWIYGMAREFSPDPDVVPIPGRQTFELIDPGFRDMHVLVLAQLNHLGAFDILDSYATNGQPADYYVPILDPSQFGDDVPQGYAEWTPSVPGAVPQTYQYDETALHYAQSVAACGAKPKLIGDTYGDNTQGATADSVYSRWEKYRLFVNKDRRPKSDLSAWDDAARTHAGRQQALREQLRRWRFANTPGAIAVLQAIQHYQRQTTRRPTTSPMAKPIHDDQYSHYATACEFGAVYLRQWAGMADRKIAKPVRSSSNALNFGRGQGRHRPLREFETWTP